MKTDPISPDFPHSRKQQAVLIVAHKDFEEVIALCRTLTGRFNVYVHFDLKTELTEAQRQILEKEHVHYCQEVAVHWGGWSIAQAEIVLMRAALENKDNLFFHTISGQDWPVIDPNDIYAFYENTDRIYMDYTPAAAVSKSHEPLVLWQKLWFHYDKINRRSLFGKIYHRCSILLQVLLRVDKFKKYGFDLELYEGSVWKDLPRYALEYLLDYFDSHESVRSVFRTGFCPDEFWAQTILCNSEYRDRIVQDNHRFINWEKRYGTYPAVLDEEDYDAIRSGDYHFARKFDSEHSSGLKEKLRTT